MAQLVLGIGGAIAGSYFGPVGSLIGSTVGSVVGSYIDSLWMGSPGAHPPTTMDLKVTADSYGQPIAIPYGTIQVPGVMIAATKLQATKQDVDVGGGLGLGTEGSDGATFSYSASFAVMLGEPPIGATAKVLRIWGDGKRLYDARPQGRNWNPRGASFRIYGGASDQMPDPFLQSHYGVTITPAYRGRIVVVFTHMQLADFGNHIPNITAEVVTSPSDAFPFSVVDPGGGTNFTNDLALDEDSGVIMKIGSDGDIAKVDTRLVETLLGPSDVTAGVVIGNSVFGSDGYLYVPQDAHGFGGTHNFDKWSKVDPASLAIVDQVGADSPTFDDDDHDLLAYTAILKSREGWPYLLGIADGGGFIGDELQIVSIGQLEAAAAFGELANRMRFVAKTRSAYGDGVYEDGEIDGSTVVNVGSPTQPQIQCDVWAVNGGTLYRLQLTDNLLGGGGTVGGGPNGANPLVLMDTIDLSSHWSASGAALLSLSVDEHALIINRGSKILKYNLDSRTVTGAELDIGSATGSEMIQGPVNGLMYFAASNHSVNEVDTVAWVVNRTIELHNFDGSLTLSSQKYDARDNALWIRSGTALYKLFLDRLTSTGVTLASIVSDICLRAGLGAGDIDVTDLEGTNVRGYVIPRQMAARDAIAPLGQAFMFEAVESDFKLKFVRLGAGVARALELPAIGAYPDQATRPDPLMITDANQRTLARRVNCRYINAGDTYQTGTQCAQRQQPLVGSSSEITLDLPIVLTDSEAKNICEKLLAKIWTNARTYQLVGSREQMVLDSVDVITVDDGTEIHRMGIDTMDIGADGTVKLSATREDAEVYVDGFTIGGGGGGDGPPPTQVIGHTDIELMDLVLVRDGDNHKGWYLAAAPDTGDPDSWLGWSLLRSIDGGASYQRYLTGNKAALIGRAVNALPAPRAWTTWDRVNSLTVRLLPGAPAPSSSTEAAVLNGANLAALGNELINFVTTVDNGDGSYTLSTLLRGQRGSDPFIGTHALGDRFVMLEFPKVVDVSDPDLNLPRDYKSQSAGDPSIPSAFQIFSDTGNRLRPLTAADPQLTDGGGGDLALAWDRRSRIGGEDDWADGSVAVPLGEASEAYEVDILDGSDVVRTLSSSTPAVTYTSADQTADFGGAQTALSVAIYQLSQTVGRGFGLFADLIEGA